jgi:hypothetical protein
MRLFEMRTPQKMNDAFDLAEHALGLAIQAVDNALGEIDANDCAMEHPEMITAVMMFAGQILSRREGPAMH